MKTTKIAKCLLAMSLTLSTPLMAEFKLGASVRYLSASGELNSYNLKAIPTIDSHLSSTAQMSGMSLSKLIDEVSNYEGKNISEFNLSIQSQLIQKYFAEVHNVNLNADVINYHLVKRGLRAAESGNELDEVFLQGRKLLDFDSKILLAKEMGSLYGNDYNFDRANGGSKSEGIVTLEELNIALNDTATSGGVCRDISVGQAQILRGLGVDNAYVVAFETIGAGHATVVVEDANHPGRLIHLNYGDVSSTSLAGTLGLRQNTSLPDTGIFFRVFDADGKPVATLPSELGQVLIEMTGGSLKDYDPGLDRAQVHLGEIHFENESYGVRGFKSQGPTGDENVGASLYSRLSGEDDFYTLESGAAIAQHRSSRYGGTLQSTSFFARVKAGLKSPYLDLPMSIRLRLHADYLGTFQYGNAEFEYRSGNTTYKDEGNIIDARSMFNLGATSFWGIGGNIKGRTSFNAYAPVQKQDVRDEGSYGIDVTTYAVNNKIAYDLNEDFLAGVNTRLIKRPMGTNMTNSVWLESRNGKGVYEVGFTDTLLGGPAPTWTPEGRKNVFFDMKFELPFAVGTKVKYVRYLESKEDMFLFQLEKKF